MKKLVAIFIIIMGVVLPMQSTAQIFGKKAEARFQVEGVCGMCKDRIENAVDLKGVKFAEWNKETSELFIVYKPKHISLEQIHQTLADAGHDTEMMKATNEAYNKVNGCCRYRELEKH